MVANKVEIRTLSYQKDAKGAHWSCEGSTSYELEEIEKLEQLRALEDGMRIDVALVDTLPLGVDTPADLARAREILTSA